MLQPLQRAGSGNVGWMLPTLLRKQGKEGFINGNGLKGAEGDEDTLGLHHSGFPEPPHGISGGTGDQKWQRAAHTESTQEPAQTKLSSGKLFHSINSFPGFPASPTHSQQGFGPKSGWFLLIPDIKSIISLIDYWLLSIITFLPDLWLSPVTSVCQNHF